MYKKLIFITFVSYLIAGCVSVPMESTEKSNMAKKFSAPTDGNAGLYIYRSGTFGGALKKDVWVDGKCIGETAADVFFYEQVAGDEVHKISTESEFSPNDLEVKTESGENYFIRQFIKMGFFVGGAGLEMVDDEKGKNDVKSLNLAKKGTCSK
jgi:hypothetical protein